MRMKIWDSRSCTLTSTAKPMYHDKLGPNHGGESTMLNDAVIARLNANLHGDFIQPSDARYSEARKVFNGMIDKRPALIVKCADVEDVIAAVELARETNLPAAVRGGGHGVTGNAVCDDGVVIDLSAMKRVRVDPGSQAARAEGG